MDQCLAETIRGFNGYIKELRVKEDGTMRFTLTQFDSIGMTPCTMLFPSKR